MTNNIVTVNVSQTIAPAPSILQRTGAFISQGATTTAVNTLSLLTQLSDLTSILAGSQAITSITWLSSVATVTTTTAHGIPIGDIVQVTIAGAVPAGYNGTFSATSTGTTTFTYPLVSNPGSETVPGTFTLEDVAELVAMATTFFAQGTATSVYVLELGVGTPAQGVTALTAYITANPFTIYSFLLPRPWAGESTFISMLANYEATTAKIYFHITATLSNYTSFTALMKCAMVYIEAPSIPATEFSAAAAFYVTLNYNPSTTNMVTPTAFSYLVGVTAYPTIGNSALRTTLKTASVNIVGTGAEGGISNTILLWGTTMDGRDFTYWYSVDWVQLNLDLDLSNEIINGSNNPQAPLYYSQNGINRLQARAQGTMTRGVSYGLVLPPVAVTAVSFANYVATNESDYKIGKYAGLAVVYTPSRGFTQIIFNVNVTDFPSA